MNKIWQLDDLKMIFNSIKLMPALLGRLSWPIPALPIQQRHENVLIQIMTDEEGDR